MPKGKSPTRTITNIVNERERIAARLAELDAVEKELRESELDAGRETFLAAVERVKIAAMSRGDARTIAMVLGNYPASEIVAALGVLRKAEPLQEAAE